MVLEATDLNVSKYRAPSLELSVSGGIDEVETGRVGIHTRKQ